jgi:hypothetical protein
MACTVGFSKPRNLVLSERLEPDFPNRIRFVDSAMQFTIYPSTDMIGAF